MAATVQISWPSSIQTALALRQAIWRKGDPHWTVCGIPDTFYTDHGSDFTSHHLEQVAADLHMAVVFSIAGKPRGRGKIERFFESVNQLFLCRQPGYTPAGSAPAKPVLTLPELDARLRTFLVETYHQQPHSETGVPPHRRWETNDFLPRLPDSLDQLDLLLLTVASVAASKWFGQMEARELYEIAPSLGISPEEGDRIEKAGQGEGLLVTTGRRVWVNLYGHTSPGELPDGEH